MPASRSARHVVEAVLSREHHVENDRVVVDRTRHPERVLAVTGHVGGMAFLP